MLKVKQYTNALCRARNNSDYDYHAYWNGASTLHPSSPVQDPRSTPMKRKHTVPQSTAPMYLERRPMAAVVLRCANCLPEYIGVDPENGVIKCVG